MKGYTDLNQSKKLAEILPIESADMKWYFWKNEIDAPKTPTFGYSKDVAESYKDTEAVYLPCWSLAALLNVLPEYIKFDGHTWKFYNDHYGMYYMNADTYDTNTFSTNSENLVDAAFEIIIKLYEQNLL